MSTEGKKAKSIVVIIPTYNELSNLIDLIPALKNVFQEGNMQGGVLIVDDNSPDGTAEFINNNRAKFTAADFFLDIMVRPSKLGLGSAYIQGYDHAIQKYQPDYILGMDADFSHDPKYIKPLYDLLSSNEMVIGSRYVKGGGISNWKFHRRVFSRGASLYSQIVLNWPIKDPTTSFVGFRVEALTRIPYKKIKTHGYGFLSELKYMAFKAGFSISEYPIIFTDRREGHSKLGKKMIFSTIINMLLLRFRKYK